MGENWLKIYSTKSSGKGNIKGGKSGRDGEAT